MSLSLSIWAIRYYWKTQAPLDTLAVRVRWIGIISCVAFWFLMYVGLHSFPQSREWLKARPVLFVFVFGPPSFLGAAFLLLPELSRGLAKHFRQDP